MPTEIVVPKLELWDSKNQRFIYTKECRFTIEHSLVSLSKWEAKWHKPFLGDAKKSTEEILDYIKCMTITQNVDPDIYKHLTVENFKQVNDYIDDPMTATWFSEKEPKMRSRKVITNEVIYYWMVAYNIPFECQKWHLNRLLTLIKVCNEENKPKKKSSANDIYRRNSELNEARLAKFKTKG